MADEENDPKDAEANPGVADEFTPGFVLLLLVVADASAAAEACAPLTWSHRAAVALDGVSVHDRLGVDEKHDQADDEQNIGQNLEISTSRHSPTLAGLMLVTHPRFRNKLYPTPRASKRARGRRLALREHAAAYNLRTVMTFDQKVEAAAAFTEELP
ncbi:hypothetical protein [Streptomyces sp. NPDC006285]|uniref:hypothetical protein n=1 Tax=Streptomyces sp. NPDC006285 TaxID=3364742 RepID=UPI0036993CA5